METSSHQVTNKRISDEIVLDIGEDGKIIGIEILNASTQLNLSSILPISFEKVA